MGSGNGPYGPFSREGNESAGAPEPDGEPEEGGGFVENDSVLVPKGEYEIRYESYRTALYFKKPRVILQCSIFKPEEYAGLPIERYYNVAELGGPPRKFGAFTANKRGDLIREFRRITGQTGRLDRISFKRFKDLRIVAQIRTVQHDYKREPLDRQDQYSIIDKLVGVLPGEDW